MKVIFRVDASSVIGSGHVMRCLTLARLLREQRCECTFICRDHPGNMVDAIRRQGFTVVVLPREVHACVASADEVAHAGWVGAGWSRDAEQTLQAIGQGVHDWLVVDHYGLDARWEGVLRQKAGSIMAIDDLADREHDCDMLLDQNLAEDFARRYDGLIAADCARLLGPRFALLQPVYGDLHQLMAPRKGAVRRVLAYFGAADTSNLSGLMMEAFSKVATSDCILDLVLSPGHGFAGALQDLARQSTNIVVHEDLPSLAPLMVDADIAVGAGGATSWERCCMGLPSLVITLAENQRPIASELHRRGYIEWLGHKDEVSLHQLEGHLGKLMAQPVPAHWSERCLELVDGMGAIRVAALMQLAQTARPVGRRAQLDDEATILRYAPAASALTCDQRHLASRVEVADSQRFRSDLRNIQQLQQYVMLAAPGLAAGVVTFRKMATESWKAMVTVGPEAAQSANMHAAFWCGAILAMRDCNQGSLQWESAAEGESTGLRIGLCSDARSWINRSVAELAVDLLRQGHSVAWAHSAGELPPGDICFYLSYGRIVDGATRARYRHNLVVHESDLPLGRGWAPMSWQILSGAREVTVTLLAAADAVDAGDIYLQERIVLEGHELHPEWRSMQAASTLKLCKEFVRSFPGILAEARPQVGRPTFYARRRPEDSRLDPKRSIREQFNLLRIVSNEQYPAYFHLDGQKYILRIEKADPS